MTEDVRYSFEYERRLRVGFVGAGGHSWRNVYPTFRYAPVDLVAICDLDQPRAAAYARMFGAERTYADYREMLRAERPEAVFIVTSCPRARSREARKAASSAFVSSAATRAMLTSRSGST